MIHFLNTLFKEGSSTCYTESPYGYKVKSAPYSEDLYFCINELHPLQDLNPTKDWHSKYAPRRADCNVFCYRNFLLEIDKMPLEEQISYVRSRVPVTSIVYSGGSSYHFIISLETPLDTYEEYTRVAKQLLMLVPAADPMCKNPSRLSRLPGRLRPDTEKMQELIYLGTRIKNSELIAKLPEIKEYPKRVYTKDEKREFVTPNMLAAVHEPDALMEKTGMGRNAFFFWLFNRFEDIELSQDRREKYVSLAYSNLKNSADFSFEEACLAARMEGLK